MTGITGATAGHAELMNATYRHQRLIYDATRAHYLLGRDYLIRQLAPPPGGTVLEIACGTGRNLARIRRGYPACRLHGLDISSEMLRTARRRLSGRAALAEADACSFDPMALFGTARFDRIVLSYSLSMIPDWQRALGNAVDALAPDGALHIVDFGDQAGLPGWFGDGIHAWLARFHVTPRPGLAVAIGRIAAERDFAARWRTLYRGYAQYSVIARG